MEWISLLWGGVSYPCKVHKRNMFWAPRDKRFRSQDMYNQVNFNWACSYVGAASSYVFCSLGTKPQQKSLGSYCMLIKTNTSVCALQQPSNQNVFTQELELMPLLHTQSDPTAVTCQKFTISQQEFRKIYAFNLGYWNWDCRLIAQLVVDTILNKKVYDDKNIKWKTRL